MKRDWKFFFKTFLKKSGKSLLVTMALVPVFYFFLNPNYQNENYFNNLLYACRIGLEISGFVILVYLVLFAVLFVRSPNLLEKFRTSLSLRIVIGIGNMVAALLFTSYLESLNARPGFSLQGMSVGFLIGTITYIGFLVFSAYKETQVSHLKLKVESSEAQLNVLKNQMQPHFLFNSLNSLAELIDSNHSHASQMTQKLSDLYREILESSKSHKSTLERELAIVEKYLDLESLRFGQRLNYAIQVDVPTKTVLLPSLLMQTLVENSVKHGISQSLQGGHILVQVKALNNGYQLQVTNTGTGMKTPTSQTGTGLANTVERLNLLYNDRHNFNIEFGDQNTTVSFWITGV